MTVGHGSVLATNPQRTTTLELSLLIAITGSIPGGLTATLALHKWRSKNATFKTPLYI